jgi:uncharacterized membrane protein YdbT with pleckstrin-like domain
MPYPSNLINEGETVALDLHPHWWFFAKHIVIGALLLLGLIGVVAVRDVEYVNSVTAFGWAVVAVIWAIWLGLKYLQWQFTNFVVTDDRVIYRHGVFAKHGVEIPLERINNINFDQRFWERIIGAGDLDIESAGREGQSHFEDVRHPDGVQQEIYRQMEVNQAQMVGGGAAPRPQSVTDQIAALADLLERGAISPAEYEAKKAQLLDRL